MSHHDNKAYLLDIQQAAELVASFIESMNEQQFLDDKSSTTSDHDYW